MTTSTELRWQVDPRSSRWLTAATTVFVAGWAALGLAVVGVAVAALAVTVLDGASVVMMAVAVSLLFAGLGLTGLLVISRPTVVRRLVAYYYLGLVDPAYINDHVPRPVRVLAPLIALPAMIPVVVVAIRGGIVGRTAILGLIGLLLFIAWGPGSRCGEGRLTGDTVVWVPQGRTISSETQIELQPGAAITTTRRWGVYLVRITGDGGSMTVSVPPDRTDVLSAIARAGGR